MSNALIVVDAQNDFLPFGESPLGVPDGFEVLGPIVEFGKHVDYVALTQDWHPANHFSFSENPQFVDGSWPVHCVQDTLGAMIHPEILAAFPDAPIFQKGTHENIEAYSGFDGHDQLGHTLIEWLDEKYVDSIIVAGLALDYCVRATALDAVYNGWGGNVCVLIEGTRAVNYVTGVEAVAEMADEQIVFVNQNRLTKLL